MTNTPANMHKICIVNAQSDTSTTESDTPANQSIDEKILFILAHSNGLLLNDTAFAIKQLITDNYILKSDVEKITNKAIVDELEKILSYYKSERTADSFYGTVYVTKNMV